MNRLLDTQANEYPDDRIDIIAEEVDEETFKKKYGHLKLDKKPESKHVIGFKDTANDGYDSYYLSTSKAGLESIDKEKIHQIILDASKTSEFYKSEEKKLSEVKERCRRYKAKVDDIIRNTELYERMMIEVNRRTEMLKRERTLKRTWIHVDMDAFYAACEAKDNASLIDKPVAVGEKNMIMTTNYIARKFGVRSGVPSFIGKRLCPDLVILKPNFAKYRKESDLFKSVVRKYDENYEAIGLDEVNMDVTDYLIRHNFDHQEGRIFLA